MYYLPVNISVLVVVCLEAIVLYCFSLVIAPMVYVTPCLLWQGWRAVGCAVESGGERRGAWRVHPPRDIRAWPAPDAGMVWVEG